MALIHSKSWPQFSVEELALIFPEWGGVGLNPFQEFALIFS